MKISKKVREEAAMLLSMVSCGGGEIGLEDVGRQTGMRKSESFNLAWAALMSSPECDEFWPFEYLEAEMMVRTGWSPGDEP